MTIRDIDGNEILTGDWLTGYETFAGQAWLEDAVFSAPPAPTEAPFSWEQAHDILDAICWGCRALARPMPKQVRQFVRCDECGANYDEMHEEDCPRGECPKELLPFPDRIPLTYDRFRAVVELAVAEYAPGSRIVTDTRWIVRPEGFTFLQFVAWVTVPGGEEKSHLWFPQNDTESIHNNVRNLTALWLVEAARGVPRRETQTVGVEAWFRRVP